MTEEELNEMYNVKNELYEAIHELVDERTKYLNKEQDETLRQQMTEEFRFWKRAL